MSEPLIASTLAAITCAAQIMGTPVPPIDVQIVVDPVKVAQYCPYGGGQCDAAYGTRRANTSRGWFFYKNDSPSWEAQVHEAVHALAWYYGTETTENREEAERAAAAAEAEAWKCKRP